MKKIAYFLPLLAIAAAEPPKTDPAKLSEMTKELASDAFGGRAPGTEGETKTIDWSIARFKALGLQPFDHVFSNPPFFDDPGALRAPAPGKVGAWMADGGLVAWTAFLLKAVREGGTITIIHRADRLADILGLLAPKAGSFRIRGIQPFADEPAKRVMVRAIKTGKAPLVLLPALVLHPRDGGKHTVEVEAILRGEAALAW